jgi:hypothetical protein
MRNPKIQFSNVCLQITICLKATTVREFKSNAHVSSDRRVVLGSTLFRHVLRESAYILLFHTTVYRYECNSAIRLPHGRRYILLCLVNNLQCVVFE